MSSALDASYAACRAIARRDARNFRYAMYLLPRHKRRAMYALYAFFRRADDIADGDASVEERRSQLTDWRRRLELALKGETTEETLLALADTISQFRIPVAYLHDVLDGVAMDLEPCEFPTFAELEVYCYRVASAVGLACIHVWGFAGSSAIDAARDCGIAFQLTNILRDLKEDASRGRIYLPSDDIQRAGYSREALRQGVVDDAFRELVKCESNRAEAYYSRAAPLKMRLAPDARRAFGTMWGIYHTLLGRIQRQPEVVMQRRISLHSAEKLWIAGRNYFGRGSLESVGVEDGA